MVGINVPIPVPIAYYTFGGWKASGFGDLNQHGPDAFRFYTKTKTVTSRWPSGVKEGAEFVIPTMNSNTLSSVKFVLLPAVNATLLITSRRRQPPAPPSRTRSPWPDDLLRLRAPSARRLREPGRHWQDAGRVHCNRRRGRRARTQTSR